MAQTFYSSRFEKAFFPALEAKISWTKIVLAIIVTVSIAFMFNASRGDSAIMDELAHIPAGYGYVHNLDYRLNPEHPPLLKALAVLPLLFLRPNFPTDAPAWQTAINGQWDMGARFLYQSGNDADKIIFYARLFPMFLTLLTELLVFLVAKRMFGEKWALLPTLLFALSPSVLAHGHYVTTDIAATFGILLSLAAFLDYLAFPSKKRLVLAGAALGLAQIMKFSAVLLLPYLIALVFIYAAFSASRDELPGFWKKAETFFYFAVKKIRSLLLIFVIGYVFVVYPVYFLFTRNYPAARQLADMEFTLASFAGGPTPAGKTCAPLRCLAETTILAGKNELTRPLAQYALGVLMVLQRSSGGNTAYFQGEVSASGNRSYFPTVYSLKEPLPVLVLLLFALVLTTLAFWKTFRNKEKNWRKKAINYFENNFAEFTFAFFILFYWFMSMRSPLNIGYRHLMPTVPLIYLSLAGPWKRWLESGGIFKFIKGMFFAVLLLWFALETVFAAPYFLSYFNEFGGGVGAGYRYVTDSNYDWGQDLLRLRDWVNAHPEAGKIAVDYFGGGSPEYYMPGVAFGWQSAKGNPAARGIHYLAVSVNSLEDATAKTASGFVRQPEDEYGWLAKLKPIPAGLGGVPKPDYRAGTSIFIYKL